MLLWTENKIMISIAISFPLSPPPNFSVLMTLLLLLPTPPNQLYNFTTSLLYCSNSVYSLLYVSICDDYLAQKKKPVD